MPTNDQHLELLQHLDAQVADRAERHKHRLPVGYYASPELLFLVTLCARRPAEPFRTPRLAQETVDALLWRRDRHRWRLYCYCLMPDHLHFLVQLPYAAGLPVNRGARGMVPDSLLDHLAGYKRYTTNQVWHRHGGQGALWQPSSHDSVIWPGRPIEEAAQYILDNPVRKQLVDTWEAYPFSAIVDDWRGS